MKLFYKNNSLVYLLCLSTFFSISGSSLKRVKDLSSALLHTVKMYGPTTVTLKRYNELRKTLEQTQASSIEDIDFVWIQQVELEALFLYEEEENKFVQELWQEYIPSGGAYKVVEPASPDMRVLIDEARQALGLQESLIMLSGRPWAFSSKDNISAPSVVSLSKIDNIHKARYHAYHELAHIFFKHTRMRWDAGEHDKYSWYLQRVEFDEAKKKADNYINLAKEVLDSSSIIGKRIIEKLVGNPPFWIPSLDTSNYQENLLRINIEREADLFALEKLFEQGHVGSVLFLIDEYSKRKVTDIGQASHPSAIEMALYASGFLVDKGLDLNQELKNWESNQQKLDDATLKPQKSKGAQDLLNVYPQWHQPKTGDQEPVDKEL